MITVPQVGAIECGDQVTNLSKVSLGVANVIRLFFSPHGEIWGAGIKYFPFWSNHAGL